MDFVFRTVSIDAKTLPLAPPDGPKAASPAVSATS
jgi:hypothetical protein